MQHSTEPFNASLAEARAIDRSDFACILAKAVSEREAGMGNLPERLGLTSGQLQHLTARWFPGLTLPDLDAPNPDKLADQDAVETLLLWRGGSATPESRWLAAIIARRALESRHLWEDLGLPNRQTLGDLIARHFPKIKAANHQNMRWKRFFYRQICADKDFSLCLSPSCDDCDERDACFAPDDA